MLWSVDAADFFEEYFHNSEAALSALSCVLRFDRVRI
jgi:hypothetical protein